jgi:hypothetical protein
MVQLFKSYSLDWLSKYLFVLSGSLKLHLVDQFKVTGSHIGTLTLKLLNSDWITLLSEKLDLDNL